MTNNQPTYSRDEVVSALISFYEFLVGLHLPAPAIKYPPPGGWPDITPQYLAFLKKNDIVVDHIRHIPFVQRDNSFEPYQIYEKTSAVDYNGRVSRRGATFSDTDVADPQEEATVLPSHVVTLADTSGGRDGYFFLFDTERGTITICDFQDGPRNCTELSQASVNFLSFSF